MHPKDTFRNLYGGSASPPPPPKSFQSYVGRTSHHRGERMSDEFRSSVCTAGALRLGAGSTNGRKCVPGVVERRLYLVKGLA
jgi:hypothetical protein